MTLLPRFGTRLIAALLAYLLCVQSAAAASIQSVQVQAGALPVNSGLAGVALGSGRLDSRSLSLSQLSLQPLAGTALSLGAEPQVRAFLAQPAQAGLEAVSRALPARGVSVSMSVRALSEQRLRPMSLAASEAVRGLEKKSADGSRVAALQQFAALSGERQAGEGSEQDPVPAVPDQGSGAAASAVLQPAAQPQAAPQPEVPAAPGSFFKVFKDPERNKSFWLKAFGDALFALGIGIYSVASPYTIENFTKNSLREGHDPRAGDEAAVKALVRQNRYTVRIVHYVTQALSYVTIPLFTRSSDGSLNWLPRSFWVRAVALAGVMGIFFSSGLLSGVAVGGISAGFLVLSAFVAVQSYFQGISVTMGSIGDTRLLGAKEVSDDERRRANSIDSLIGAVTDIVAPVLAGLLSKIKDFRGKIGVGSGFAYGIYSLAVGGAGFFYAAVKLFKGKASSGDAAEVAPAGKRLGPGGMLKQLGSSLSQGTKLVLKNRFLATLFGMSFITDLFADILGFNVLPEYVEGLVQSNSGVAGLLAMPVLGPMLRSASNPWVAAASGLAIVVGALLPSLLKKLGVRRSLRVPPYAFAVLALPLLGWAVMSVMSTAMGVSGLLVVFASVGSILANMCMGPVRQFLDKLGFKTEESLTIPLGVLAALEIPLFWLMISVPSLFVVVPLYGLQSFLGLFLGVVMSGLNQKKQGDYSEDQLRQMLSAESLWGMFATVGSLFVAKSMLGLVSTPTLLLIAAIFTTVYGAAQLAFPWLGFSKAERSTPKVRSVLGGAAAQAKRLLRRGEPPVAAAKP